MLTKKLKNIGGFTLTELLCAIAIVTLLTTCLTVGTGLSAKVMGSITKASKAQTLGSTLSNLITDELRYAHDIETDGSGNITSYISLEHNKRDKTLNDTPVVLELDEGRLYAFKKGSKDKNSFTQLASDRLYGDNLKVSEFTCKVNGDKIDVTLKISDNTGKDQFESSFEVKPFAKPFVKPSAQTGE